MYHLDDDEYLNEPYYRKTMSICPECLQPIGAEIYEENEKDLDLIIGPLMGAQDFSHDFHYICFNEKTLSRHLLNAGFIEVRKWIHGSDPYTSFPDWSGRCFEVNGKTYNISLNLEGIK